MDKLDIIRRIGQEKIVAVIRANSSEEGLKIVDAVVKGGIKLIELTLTVPGAIDIIKELVKKYDGEDVVIGAGTVLDSETGRLAILSGAKFVVSPSHNLDLIRLCNRYRVPIMPGAQTVSEVIANLEAGADIIKIFPGDAYSPKIIKSFNGPLPQGLFMPTGGVSVENAAEWLKAGAYAIGTGSSRTKGAQTGDFNAITEEAKRFVAAVNKND